MALKGTLADLGIIDLIQFPHTGRKSGRLSIESAGKQAELYYQKGELVHASLGGVTGLDVLVKLVDWLEGGFEFMSDEQPPARTIEMDLHRAVMQALKLHDEQKAAEEARKAAEAASGTSEDRQALLGKLAEYVAANEFALHACILSEAGELMASADGREGTPQHIDQIRAILHCTVVSYPRGPLSRLVAVDGTGTVVVMRLPSGTSLIVLASNEASLGAVSMSVNRLAVVLE